MASPLSSRAASAEADADHGTAHPMDDGVRAGYRLAASHEIQRAGARADTTEQTGHD